MLDADIETFKGQLPSEASARLFSGMFFAFMFVYINILSTTERQKGKERVSLHHCQSLFFPLFRPA